MKTSFTQAITPKAFEHWNRSIGFGNRLELQGWQWAGKGTLHAINTLIPGQNPRVEKSINWVENRINILQEDPYLGSELFKLAVVKRRRLANILTAIGALIPTGLLATGYYLHDVQFNLLDIGFLLGWGASALILSHFGKAYAIRKMAASEKKYTSLFEQAPIGIISIDSEGNIFEINQFGLDILGSPSRDATKQINMLTFPLLREAGISDKLQAVLAGATNHLEFECGYTSHWGKDTALRVITERSNGGALAVFEDISEKKAAESALRLSEKKHRDLYDNAPIGFHNISPEGKILDVNTKWLKVLGYSREQVIGHSIFDFIIPEQRKEAEVRFKSRLSGRRVFPEIAERQYLREDGSVIYVKTYNTIIRENGGEAVMIQTSFEDITEQKEVQNLKLREAAVESALAISKSLADYLNNNMMGVVATLSLILMDGDSSGNPEVVRLLKRLVKTKAAADRIVKAINQNREYLGFARASNKLDLLSLKKVDINEVIQTSVEETRGDEIRIGFLKNEGLPLIAIDKGKIHSALKYYLKSALAAVSKNGKTGMVVVKLKQEAEGVGIEIIDRGERHESFGLAILREPPFQHGVTFLYEEYLSLSLGLMIFEAHSGKCEIERDQERGTTKVSIWLPFAPYEAKKLGL